MIESFAQIKENCKNDFFLDTFHRENLDFPVKVGNSLSLERPMIAGVPQRSVLLPILYQLFTFYLSELPVIMIGTYADCSAILDHYPEGFMK